MQASEPTDEDVCESRLASLEREMLDWVRLFKKREGL
jgi:hypothetical protein